MLSYSDAMSASHKIQGRATYSVYFSVHCDRDFMFVIFAGASVQPRKAYRRMLKLE